MVAVDGPADAVKKTVKFPSGKENEGTVLVSVVVAFVLMVNNTKVLRQMKLGQQNAWALESAYASASVPGRSTWIASAVRISGEWASSMNMDCFEHRKDMHTS